MTTKETITWIPVEVERPSTHERVLGDFGRDVRVTFFDGELWHMDHAFVDAPTHWAAMPTGARP